MVAVYVLSILQVTVMMTVEDEHFIYFGSAINYKIEFLQTKACAWLGLLKSITWVTR